MLRYTCTRVYAATREKLDGASITYDFLLLLLCLFASVSLSTLEADGTRMLEIMCVISS